jgi:hypothetical protein
MGQIPAFVLTEQVDTAITLLSSDFCDITPYIPPKVSRSFGKTFRLRLKGLTVNQFASCFMLVSCLAYFLPWRWRWHVPQKHPLTFSILHGIIFQKVEPPMGEPKILTKLQVCILKIIWSSLDRITGTIVIKVCLKSPFKCLDNINIHTHARTHTHRPPEHECNYIQRHDSNTKQYKAQNMQCVTCSCNIVGTRDTMHEMHTSLQKTGHQEIHYDTEYIILRHFTFLYWIILTRSN